MASLLASAHNNEKNPSVRARRLQADKAIQIENLSTNGLERGFYPCPVMPVCLCNGALFLRLEFFP